MGNCPEKTQPHESTLVWLTRGGLERNNFKEEEKEEELLCIVKN